MPKANEATGFEVHYPVGGARCEEWVATMEAASSRVAELLEKGIAESAIFVWEWTRGSVYGRRPERWGSGRVVLRG